MVTEFLMINESLGVQCAIFRQSRLIVKFVLMSSCIIAKNMTPRHKWYLWA